MATFEQGDVVKVPCSLYGPIDAAIAAGPDGFEQVAGGQ
jgi:hypothetical protein